MPLIPKLNKDGNFTLKEADQYVYYVRVMLALVCGLLLGVFKCRSWLGVLSLLPALLLPVRKVSLLANFDSRILLKAGLI